jgi:Predicted sugar phosphate isomerase involved in capsule formation
LKDYFEENFEIVRKSLKSVDNDTFDRLCDDCVGALRNERKIIVTGLGKNVPICEKFAGMMWSLGLNAAFMHTNTAMHGDLGMIQEKDVVIVLSKSGETVESVYLMEHLRNRDITDWTITFNSQSSLARAASNSLSLALEKEGDPWNIVPNNSTTAYLILLQTLVLNICDKMDVKLADFKKNHPGGHIGKVLEK